MGDTLKLLEFKARLNSTQKKTKDWEATICSPEIVYELSPFLKTRIGEIWLKSPEGQAYLKWQNE